MWRKKKQSFTLNNQQSPLDDTQKVELPTQTASFLRKAASVENLRHTPTHHKTFSQSHTPPNGGSRDSSPLRFTSPTAQPIITERSRKSISISSDLNSSSRTLSETPYVLAVVGTTKVGKSTLIRTGLDNLVAHKTPKSASSEEGPQVPCHFTQLSVENNTFPIEVMEIDESNFDKQCDPPEFPRGVGPIHGGLVCYDVTERDTMECLPDLLNAFQSRNIPTYLLGLKSDQTEARKVDPDDGLKLGNEFGVRHIEMNAMTVDGVQRMKEIFAKLVRKCSRKRGERRRSSVIDSETNPVVTYPAPEVPEKTVEVAVESRVLEAESRVMDNLDEHTEDDDEEDKGQYKLPKFGNDAFGAKETLFDVFTTYDIRRASIHMEDTNEKERGRDSEASNPSPTSPSTSRTRKIHHIASDPSLPKVPSLTVPEDIPPLPTPYKPRHRPRSPSLTFTQSRTGRSRSPSQPPPTKRLSALSSKRTVLDHVADEDSDGNEFVFPNSKRTSKRASSMFREGERNDARRDSLGIPIGGFGSRRGSRDSGSRDSVSRDSGIESRIESRRDSLGVPVVGLTSRRGSKDSGESIGTGLTIDDLMDKLTSTETMKNADEHFVAVFLIFYRRFMRPKDLVECLIARFEEEQNNESDTLPTAVQTKIHQVFVQWLTNYWNDFNNARTRELLVTFLDHTSRHAELTPICDDLAPLIIREPPTDDRDLGWASADLDINFEIMKTGSWPSSRPSSRPSSPSPTEDREKQKGKKDSGYAPAGFDITSISEDVRDWRLSQKTSLSDLMFSVSAEPPRSPSSTKSLSLPPPIKPNPSTPTTATFTLPAAKKRRSSIAALMPSTSSSTATTPMATFVNSLRQHPTSPNESEFGGGVVVVRHQDIVGRGHALSSAVTLINTLGGKEKVQEKHVREAEYRTLMDTSDETIAQQLTWVEGKLFARIKPRDYVRHIWTSKSATRTYSSNSNPSTPSSPSFGTSGTCCLATPMSPCSIAASISHFNFVSTWVSTLIVSQSKLSRRAKVLEKFMCIAVALRNMNNYNTLMAILAGINSAPIMRLKNTRDLISVKKIHKSFKSLERLMGSDKSFSTYRLALKNSEPPGIPYIGIHMQDLLSLVEGNKDFRSDGAVHWDKFRLMGETIMNLERFQSRTFDVKDDANVLVFIADTNIPSEDELYSKSLEIEPRGSRMSGSANKLKEMLMKS